MNVFLVAGESSADSHGAALLRELKARAPGLTCYGVGGEQLAREGMEILVDAKTLNVVGISDWFDRVGEVVGAYRQVCRAIKARRPDIAILLDLPDFNLRLAGKIKKLGIPVVYYISPQVWAWRKYRIRKIRRVVDRMLVVFPFEKTFYEKHGVPVEFVGHPLLETLSPRSGHRPHAEILKAPRIALLPGSRKSELKFHAPVLSEAASCLWEKFPMAQIWVPVANTLSVELVREALPDPRIRLIPENAREVLEWADVAAVASGTATLETALIGTPFTLFYILSGSSAFIARRLLRYRNFFGMPNLLHGREVVAEFLQGRATPEGIAGEIARLIESEPYRAEVESALRGCREKLGTTGASRSAAGAVLSVLGNVKGSGAQHGTAVPQLT